MSFNANNLRNEKKSKHDFKTRKHHKKTMQISHVPLPENERIEKVSFFPTDQNTAVLRYEETQYFLYNETTYYL